MSSLRLSALFGSGAAVAVLAAAPMAEAKVWRAQADALGTSVDMAVSSCSEAEAHIAFAAALAEIGRLDAVLSGWRDDSEMAVLNHSSLHTASPDLFAVLSACEAWRARTGGAFNPGLGHVEAAWRGAQSRPHPETLCNLAADAATPIALDPATRVVRRTMGVRIAADGLAKGYILDAALTAARWAAPRAQGMMLDIGGDILCFGAGEDGQCWRVGVSALGRLAENAAPFETLRLSNRALAVSGVGARDHVVGGERLSHLIDPATGQPAAPSLVAVTAPRAADADAAATALSAMTPVEAIAQAESWPGFEAMIQTASGERLATQGWQAICQAALPSGFAVDIDYELPKIEAGNYKRPYTVIWVTDAERNLIKTLHIAGNRPSWMEENYVWYRRIGRRDPEQIAAQAKPTRAPGRYTVTWDGTNDAGARVPQGAYIVHVEAVREHGGHGYQQIPVTLGAAAANAVADKNAELGGAQVRYLKKP